jgi:flagellar basal body-associated protein FliL
MVYLTFLSALLLSGIAAYYSIVGLASIFVGAFWPVVFMGSSLEFAKVVTTSWLYRNWKKIPFLLKTYLTVAVVILMLITSMGIFGYLSKSHLEQSTMIGPIADKVAMYDDKIRTLKENIDANKLAIKQLDAAVDQVMARTEDSKGAERSVQIRRAQQKERSRLNDEIAGSQKEIVKITEEKSPIQNELRKSESDFGPIKYVAELIYGSSDRNIIDKAVRLVIILIMLVFDPLAVLLLIAGNMTMKENETEVVANKPIIKRKEPEPQEEVVEVEKENITNIDDEEDETPPEGLVRLFQNTNTEDIVNKKVEIYHEPGYEEPTPVKKIEPKYDYDAAFAFREKDSAPYEIPTLRDKK